MAKCSSSPMLPGELSTRRQIRKEFSDDFELARRVLELGCRVLKSLCLEEASKFGSTAKAACVGGYTKACKQYRAVHSLCELGLSDDAQILVRSMFETSLVVRFLLRRRVVFRDGSRTPPAAPRGRLSVEFRGNLFAAQQALKERKIVGSWLTTSGLKRVGKKLKGVVDKWVDDEESRIGTAWMEWLKKGDMFGLNVLVMARNLGIEKWYAGLYRPLSAKVHSSDAIDHLKWDDPLTEITPKLEPDMESPTEPLDFANDFFMMMSDIINDRFKLGYNSDINAIRRSIEAKMDGAA